MFMSKLSTTYVQLAAILVLSFVLMGVAKHKSSAIGAEFGPAPPTAPTWTQGQPQAQPEGKIEVQGGSQPSPGDIGLPGDDQSPPIVPQPQSRRGTRQQTPQTFVQPQAQSQPYMIQQSPQPYAIQQGGMCPQGYGQPYMIQQGGMCPTGRCVRSW